MPKSAGQATALPALFSLGREQSVLATCRILKTSRETTTLGKRNPAAAAGTRITTSWITWLAFGQRVDEADRLWLGGTVVVVGLDDENGVVQPLNTSPPTTTKRDTRRFTSRSCRRMPKNF